MLNRTAANPSGSSLEEREGPATVCGIEGRATFIAWGPDRPGLFMHQTFKASRPFAAPGIRDGARIVLQIRFDDNCRNGFNSFAITGEVREPRARDITMGGCLHDELAKAFPEVAHLIRWHLSDTRGPMHYAANTVYLAGDRDHNGLRAGETRQIRNGRTGLPAWRLMAVGADGAPVELHSVEKSFDGETPPELAPSLQWFPWNRIGEGKARDLDAARRVAVWPDATDEELSVEPDELKAALAARLPALLAEMRADIEAAGFTWSEPAPKAEG